MFSISPKTNFSFSVAFYLLSANAFHSDQSKNLSFGEELINTGVNVESINSSVKTHRF